MLNEQDRTNLERVASEIRNCDYNNDASGGKKLKQLFQKIVSSVPDTDTLLSFIDTTDFYIAPASTKYHGAFKFGLLQHSLLVTMILCEKSMSWMYKDLPGITAENVIISATMHDICKADYYVEQQKWRKDLNGKWESYSGWTVEEAFPCGHGDKSVILLNRCYKSNPHIDLAVRWHMGLLSTNNPQDFGKAASKSPLTLLLHTADFEATYLFEGQEFKDGIGYIRG